jgi:hypothetical protein
MSAEIAALLQAGRVTVWVGGEQWRMTGLDVSQGEVQITVAPRRDAPWIVVQVDGRATDTHAARTLGDALDLAQPERGAILTAWEVTAPDAGAARLLYAKGKRLFQFAWLGA